MNKQAVFAHYCHIIDSVLDESMFFQTYLQAPTYLELPWSFDNCTYHSGATRGCFVDEDYDYVVKFDIEGDELYASACAREAHIYQMAKVNNLENYLCEVEYLGTYRRTIKWYDIDRMWDFMPYGFDGYSEEDFDKVALDAAEALGAPEHIEIALDLYGYRRASFTERATYVASDYEMTTAKKYKGISPLTERHVNVLARFIHDYDEMEAKRFSDFLSEYYVNDIHNGNIGYIDGHVCLIDYAGYHDAECWEVDYNGEEII